MLSFILVIFFVASSSGFQIFPDYEEAKWELVNEQPEDYSYEYRRYLASAWVGTNVTGVDFDKTGEKAFWRLYRYINGRNDLAVVMPMTVPVITTFRDRPCPFCNTTFTMYFYIPMKYQNMPPQPTDPLVTISWFPEAKYYVRRFSGYASANDWRTEANKLFTSLQVNGVYGVDSSAFIASGYDSPYKFFYRRNEVWLGRKDNSTSPW